MEAALVLDWLLYISRITDKMARVSKLEDQLHNSEMRGCWLAFADIIFVKYGNEKEVVSAFLELTKKFGYGKTIVQSALIRNTLAHRPDFTMDLELLFDDITFIIDHDYTRAEKINYFEIDLIQRLNTDSPKVVAALLKFMYMSGTIGSSDLTLKGIQGKWIYYFERSPEEMPALLKVYLRMGKFDSVKKFFRYLEGTGTSCISKLFCQESHSIVEFLYVAQAVREDRNFGKCIMQCLREKSEIMDTVAWKPDIVLPLLRHGILSNPMCADIRMLIRAFLYRYPIMFEYNPEQAVYILYQIFLKQIDHNEGIEFMSGCIYSMQHYNLVLEASVKTAAHLLTSFEKMKEFRFLTYPNFMEESLDNVHEMMPFYVTCCFNKALFTCDRTVVSALEGLLDALLPEVRAKLKDYFNNQFPFLKAYSWKLAKKVKAMYRLD